MKRMMTPKEYIGEHLPGAVFVSGIAAFISAMFTFGIGLILWESLFKATGMFVVGCIATFILSMLAAVFVLIPLAYRAYVREEMAKAEKSKAEKPSDE